MTNEEIEVANTEIIGRNTIEGAPGLKDEHLPIFDCAQPSGAGVRSIAPSGHVNMMVAAQPFISGAISKTINMPSDCSIEDVREAYNLSYATMNKACAVYRDGSKLSQPLMSQLVDSMDLEEEDDEESVVEKMVEDTASALPLPEPVAMPVAKALVENYIAARGRSPTERGGELQGQSGRSQRTPHHRRIRRRQARRDLPAYLQGRRRLESPSIPIRYRGVYRFTARSTH